MGEIVSAAVPVNFWPSFNADLLEKTLNIFSISKFAKSGNFIFPNEISHSEQQQLKRERLRSLAPKYCKVEQKNILGLLTVEKIELTNAVNSKLNKT